MFIHVCLNLAIIPKSLEHFRMQMWSFIVSLSFLVCRRLESENDGGESLISQFMLIFSHYFSACLILSISASFFRW